jgi:hypothetical protein
MNQQTQSGPNRRVGSIEHVGEDGFILEASDISDPAFFGGKRLFRSYDDLLRFLAEYLLVFKSQGNSYGVKHPDIVDRKDVVKEVVGGNGTSKLSSVTGGA